MTPPTRGEKAQQVYFAAVWLHWRCVPWHLSWQMGDGLLFLKKKQQQNQQTSSAFITKSPSPLARQEMKVFPSATNLARASLRGMPVTNWGCLCAGDQAGEASQPLSGQRVRQSTSLGCLCSPGARWPHPATSEPCMSMNRAAGTGQIITKLQPASHLGQPRPSCSITRHPSAPFPIQIPAHSLFSAFCFFFSFIFS